MAKNIKSIAPYIFIIFDSGKGTVYNAKRPSGGARRRQCRMRAGESPMSKDLYRAKSEGGNLLRIVAATRSAAQKKGETLK